MATSGGPLDRNSLPAGRVVAVGCLVAVFLALTVSGQLYLSMINHGHSFIRLLSAELARWLYWPFAAPIVLRLGGRLMGPQGLDRRQFGRAAGVFEDVERVARERRIALRGGCFCNPGAAEHAFGIPVERARRCLRGPFTISRLRACLPDRAVGALRASTRAPLSPGPCDLGDLR